MPNIFFNNSSLVSELPTVTDENDLATSSALLVNSSSLSRELPKFKNLNDPVSVRHLVESFYKLQQLRVQFAQQCAQLSQAQHNIDVLKLVTNHLHRLEATIVVQLQPYVNASVPGTWAISQYGIGPVLTSGLVAHIDIIKAPTAGSIWRYAGLDPSIKTTHATKRPWNEQLKALTHKIGVSFARHADHPDCFYGKLYLLDLQRRTANQTEAHEPLSEDHLRAQARRFAVKIFLSHYHAVAYQDYHHSPAPRPQHVDYEGQQFYVSIPHFPFPDEY